MYAAQHLKRIFIAAIVINLISCDRDGSLNSDDPVVRTDERPNIIFIFTDDQGYADIGAQGVVTDILTPNIDQMARDGVRMTDGYVTAPQCTPSRAALMSGRYQQKFGVDNNMYSPFPIEQETFAEKLVDAGYSTGMVGKWHLEIDQNSREWYEQIYAPGSEKEFNVKDIPFGEKLKYYPENRGFQETFFGYRNSYRANFNLTGKLGKYRTIVDKRFRVDVVSDAAVTYIDRHKEDPFFLYVAYYAPHVPLEATPKYLDRFPGEMPERRRHALAMIAAVDDGVGRIMDKLERHGLSEDTIVFFISDNGAPLAMTKEDVKPVSEGGPTWDGSLNDPWVGEKGMLTEGAVRIPFIAKWKNRIPAGMTYSHPVISLDAVATAASLAQVSGLDEFDGINLLSHLNEPDIAPDRSLYWRFWNQSAIRRGDWKYLQVSDEREYLFDLSSDQHEKINHIDTNRGIADSLKQDLANWAETLKRPGLPYTPPRDSENAWYNFYFKSPTQ